jgi:hypothetical protein
MVRFERQELGAEAFSVSEGGRRAIPVMRRVRKQTSHSWQVLAGHGDAESQLGNTGVPTPCQEDARAVLIFQNSLQTAQLSEWRHWSTAKQIVALDEYALSVQVVDFDRRRAEIPAILVAW